MLLHYVRVNSSREHLPRANPGHLLHVESRGAGYLAVDSVPAPGHLQTIKNVFRNILSPFPTAFRSKGFKQSRTVILE